MVPTYVKIGKAHSQVDPGAREGQGPIYQGQTIKASQLRSAHAQDNRRMLGGQSVLDGWVSNKPGADRGPEGGVPVKDMVKGGAGQKRGSLFGD